MADLQLRIVAPLKRHCATKCTLHVHIHSFHFVDLPFDEFFSFADVSHNTRGHSHQHDHLVVPACRSNFSPAGQGYSHLDLALPDTLETATNQCMCILRLVFVQLTALCIVNITHFKKQYIGAPQPLLAFLNLVSCIEKYDYKKTKILDAFYTLSIECVL